jgi:hypothetical protein
MLSWPVEPALLAPLLPRRTELDRCAGRAFLSLVAFRFLRTRVRGLPIPLHQDFDEVNLRFYVRRDAEDGPRRGVVFVKELVPRRAIAFVARTLYGEPYHAVKMRHRLEPPAPTPDGTGPGAATGSGRFAFEWRFAGRWNRVEAAVRGEPDLAADDSLDAFITEHYWGYTRQRDGGTTEYRVEHPRWRVWRAEAAALDCATAELYGRDLAAPLGGPPSSALVAEGSDVAVHRGRRLR